MEIIATMYGVLASYVYVYPGVTYTGLNCILSVKSTF